MTHIFISHSRIDNAFTRFLSDALTEAELDVWVDFDDIPEGDPSWLRTVQDALENCAVFIVVMSGAGRASEWVERETLMAMELGKPLYVVRIEAMPLPLHLINRQFSDFTEEARWPQSASRLIRTLKRAVQSDTQKNISPRRNLSTEPNAGNFFKYLEQRQYADPKANARIARALFDWAREHMDGVDFGGKITPGMHARVQLGDQEVIAFTVWAYPRQPAVQIQFQYLAKHPPYDDTALRRSTLLSLNSLATKPFLLDQADRRPTLPLHTLHTDGTLAQFLQIIEEIIDNLRSN